jgi:hypothetical protein
VIVAPTQGYAVVERRGDSTMGMLQFSGTTAGPVINLPTDIARPSIVTFSPSGAAVAIHSKLEGKTHIIKGLPSAPQLVRNIARNDLPAELMYLALADDEQTLVAGASNAVYLIEDGHAPEWLRGANRLGGLAPVPGTDSVLVAERNDGRVSLLKNIRTVPSSSPLAMGLPDMESEILLQVESGRAVVGGAGSRKLRLIDLKTSQIEVLELTSAATMARRLGVSRSVLLSYKLAEPAWALDLRGSNGALYFVPATAPGEN